MINSTCDITLDCVGFSEPSVAVHVVCKDSICSCLLGWEGNNCEISNSDLIWYLIPEITQTVYNTYVFYLAMQTTRLWYRYYMPLRTSSTRPQLATTRNFSVHFAYISALVFSLIAITASLLYNIVSLIDVVKGISPTSSYVSLITEVAGKTAPTVAAIATTWAWLEALDSCKTLSHLAKVSLVTVPYVLLFSVVAPIVFSTSRKYRILSLQISSLILLYIISLSIIGIRELNRWRYRVNAFGAGKNSGNSDAESKNIKFWRIILYNVLLFQGDKNIGASNNGGVQHVTVLVQVQLVTTMVSYGLFIITLPISSQFVLFSFSWASLALSRSIHGNFDFLRNRILRKIKRTKPTMETSKLSTVGTLTS